MRLLTHFKYHEFAYKNKNKTLANHIHSRSRNLFNINST